MADDAVEDGARYWAFISYSHKDAAFGRRLHRRLENYALPRRLAGRATLRGIVPRRLTPIFRDREELAAAHDLSAEVRAALAASRSLIVVCSPSAAASPWVSREVELFRALHPDRPILAAIAKGEPGESFPSALRGTLADGTVIEPLAADFRREGDGAQAALLKLVAGIAGIGLDELVQRDAQRNLQRVTAVTATALLAMLVMGLLTIFALRARTEAERQRAEAEGLVGFMRTDLREKLKAVGRLDVMTAVNEHALAYYDDQKDQTVADVRAHRAQLLQGIGEDDENRNDYKSAIERFHEAYAITGALLLADPANPQRIYDHAQSEYWMGNYEYFQQHIPQAEKHFEEYDRLARRLVELSPRNWRYLRERAFAEGDLCSLTFRPPRRPADSIKLCKIAMQDMLAASRGKDAYKLVADDLSNRYGWMADAYRLNYQDANELDYRNRQNDLLSKLLKDDPTNAELLSEWISLQRSLARIEAETGNKEKAIDILNKAAIKIDSLVRLDASNASWSSQQEKIQRELLKIQQLKKEK